ARDLQLASERLAGTKLAIGKQPQDSKAEWTRDGWLHHDPTRGIQLSLEPGGKNTAAVAQLAGPDDDALAFVLPLHEGKTHQSLTRSHVMVLIESDATCHTQVIRPFQLFENGIGLSRLRAPHRFRVHVHRIIGTGPGIARRWTPRAPRKRIPIRQGLWCDRRRNRKISGDLRYGLAVYGTV